MTLEKSSQEEVKRLINDCDGEQKPVTDSDFIDFYSRLSQYGFLDIETAIDKFKEVGLTASDLADEVKEFADNIGDGANIDVCYVAWDYILQVARNKIRDILQFDILNDIEGGAEFSTAGNYTATTFDYSQEAIDQLTEKLETTKQQNIDRLSENDCVRVFLEGVGIDSTDIIALEESN